MLGLCSTGNTSGDHPEIRTMPYRILALGRLR